MSNDNKGETEMQRLRKQIIVLFIMLATMSNTKVFAEDCKMLSTSSPIVMDTDTTEVYQEFGTLTVKMNVSGNQASRDKEFNVAFSLPASWKNHQIAVIKISSNGETKEEVLNVDDNGKCNVCLQHNTSITFEGLTKADMQSLKGINDYGVIEEKYASEGYKTTYKTTTDDLSLAVTITNTKNAYLPTGIVQNQMSIVLCCLGLAGLIAAFAFKKDKGDPHE